MDQGILTSLAQKSFLIILYLSAPVLGISLIIGLIVSIFQATTQIQEQTLSFAPKIVGVIISLALFGPWMLNKLIEFTTNLYLNIGEYIK